MAFRADLPIMGQIHPDIYYIGVSSIDIEQGLTMGRPFGGLRMLWKKTLGQALNIYNASRPLGPELSFGTKKLLLINWYLPYYVWENLDDYMLYLSKIDVIISSADTIYDLAMGDFNADTSNFDHICNIVHHFGSTVTKNVV